MGLGTSPLGTFPLGYGTPVSSAAPGDRVLDDGTGRQTGSRMIDERTRTYVFNEQGRIRGMNDTRQLVLLAVATVKGSSAQSRLGHSLRSIQDIGPDFDKRVDNELRGALASLVAERRIEILSIRVARLVQAGSANEKGASILLRWRDLTDPTQPTFEERVS